MAQKTRTGIDQSITANVYDNTQKEILAAMVREVLGDFRDSYFNLLDDELQNLKFNSTQTLGQYLNTIAGSVPKSGTVLGIDVGEGYPPSTNFDIAPGGIISSANFIQTNGRDTEIEINFSESIEGKKIIPVFKTRSLNYSRDNDLAAPVIFFVSSNKIRVALREFSDDAQGVDLEIIII